MEKAIVVIEEAIKELYVIAGNEETEADEKTRIYKAIDTLAAENNSILEDLRLINEVKPEDIFSQF